MAGWESSYVQCPESTVALSSNLLEQLRLLESHRNRVVQIRRAVELDNIFHVRTDLNCGTRPGKVKLEDALVGSRRHRGVKWMTLPLDEAVREEFITPVTRLGNCQVIETSDHSEIIDGIIRLVTEVGYPKYFMVVQDSAVMKALQQAKSSALSL